MEEIKVKNIYQRICAVMSELTIVSKERKNKFGNFQYVGHDDVTEPIHPLFVKHGIVQKVSIAEFIRDANQMLRVKCLIAWVNVDNPSDELVVESWGESVATTTDKKSGESRGDDLQVGKAVSYAVKVAQLKNFCLVGGIPDNEESAQKPADEKPQEETKTETVPDEEIVKLHERYLNAGSKADLNEINKDVTKLLKNMTQMQEDRLAQEYQKAVGRINGKQ
jgi:hypothetical protein